MDEPNQDKETIRGGSTSSCSNNILGPYQFRFGASSMQGWRPNNEDKFICQDNLEQLPYHGLFCVLDGHGGSDAAQFASDELIEIFVNTEEWQNYVYKVTPYLPSSSGCGGNNNNNNKPKKKKKGINNDASPPNNKAMKEMTNLLESALIKSFVELDRELYIQHHHHDEVITKKKKHSSSSSSEESSTAGSTAVAVLITPFMLICANIGDSRCVLARSYTATPMSVMAYPLSDDHKPNIRDDERQRIIKSGGYVTSSENDDDGGRVDGELAVSRAFGDFEFKDLGGLLLLDDHGHDDNYNPFEDEDDMQQLLQRAQNQKVSAYPEILCHQRDDTTDRFVILACDGIWDVISNEDCIDWIAAVLHQGQTNDLGLICEQLLDKCLLQLGSEDNMTMILILLEGGQKLIGTKKKKITTATNTTTRKRR